MTEQTLRLAGSKTVLQNGPTHIVRNDEPRTICGKMNVRNTKPVAGEEVSCEKCAELTGMTHEPDRGRFWTSSRYGRVTLAEFERRDDESFYGKTLTQSERELRFLKLRRRND